MLSQLPSACLSIILNQTIEFNFTQTQLTITSHQLHQETCTLGYETETQKNKSENKQVTPPKKQT